MDDYFTRGRYLESSFNENLRSPTCLVIPIPVPHNYNYELGFLDMSTKTVQFLSNLTKFKKDTQNDPTLDIYDMDIYKMSIASSKYDLVNKINWNIFIKPVDFEKRLSTLDNTTLFYTDYKWIYIILTSEYDIQNDGFGIVYKSSDVDYFPICREDKVNTNIKYNAEIYHFSKNNGSNTKVGPLKTDGYTTILTNNDLNILNYLSTIPVQFERGKIKQMKLDNIKYCNYYKIMGNGQNKNLYLMK
jgi:hypothetical protein